MIGKASTPTTKAGIAKVFRRDGAMPDSARGRWSLAVGEPQLQEYGHEVIVANPRNVRLIGERRARTTGWTLERWLA